MARAYRSSDPFLITVETPRGGILRGLRRSGDIVVRSFGRHHVRGRVQPGLSVRDVLAEWVKREEVVRGDARVRAWNDPSTDDLDAPIVTQAQADRRERARVRRAERADAAAEARAMREHAALGEAARSSDAPLLADSASVARYADLARASFRATDARLAYVLTLARWHGGAASPNLHAPMAAALALRRSLTRLESEGWLRPYPWRAQLDELADAVARRAFGSDMRAARVWYRALGG